MSFSGAMYEMSKIFMKIGETLKTSNFVYKKVTTNIETSQSMCFSLQPKTKITEPADKIISYWNGFNTKILKKSFKDIRKTSKS